MRKLLMLGTSLGSADIVRKAQTMGCHVIVTDGLAPEASRSKLVADERWPIDTSDVDALERRCRAEGVDAVFAGVSEFNLDRTFELCDRLDLPRYATPEGWGVARDKSCFLDLCHRVGLPTPRQYRLCAPVMDAACAEADVWGPAHESMRSSIRDVRFPVVVKPVDGCGNNGVSFCDDADELLEAWRLVREVSDNPRVIVEQRLTGPEFIASFAMADGEARLMHLGTSFIQPGAPTNLYCFGSSFTCHYEQFLREDVPGIRRLVRAAGCRDGIVWFQGKYDVEDGRFRFFEMGHRLSADMSYDKMITACNMDMIRWMLELQLGERHDVSQLPRTPERQMGRAFGVCFMFAARDGVVTRTEGVDELDGAPTDDPDARPGCPEDTISTDVFVRPGTRVRAHQLMGKMTFHVWSPQAACDTLRHINRVLRCVDEDGRDLMLHFTQYDALMAYTQEALGEHNEG